MPEGINSAQRGTARAPAGGMMGLKRDPVFWGLALLEIAAVFLLDLHHEAEQGVYSGVFIPSARGLWETGTFSLYGEKAFYPMWGYPLFVLICGFSPAAILAAQGALCFAAIAFLYATLPLQPRFFHLAAVFPFAALCSIKWPNAITGALLIFFICSFAGYLNRPRLRLLLIGGFAAGAAVNMRGESWIWGAGIFFALVFPMRAEMRARGAKFGIAVILIQLLCIGPWAIRAYAVLGTPRLTPTHGGGLALVSLGQYPDNPWGVVNTDSWVHAFAAQKNLGSPYSPAADAAMRREFIRLVAAHPAAFAEKALHNLGNFFYRGVFTGQFFTLTLTEAGFWKTVETIRAGGAGAAFAKMPLTTAITIMLYFCLDYLFRAGWLFLLFGVGITVSGMVIRGEPVPPMAALTVTFTLATIALVSFLYYEPRHVTYLWLPLAASLLTLKAARTTEDP